MINIVHIVNTVAIWLVMIYCEKTHKWVVINDVAKDAVWLKLNPLWSVVQWIKGRTYLGPKQKICVVVSMETPMKSRKERSIWVSGMLSASRAEITGWIHWHSIWISSAEPHSAGTHCSFGNSSRDVSAGSTAQYIILFLAFCLYLYTKWSRE